MPERKDKKSVNQSQATLDVRCDDMVTLITGASSGIGAAIAMRFARAGSKVALAARRKDKLQEMAERIEKAGGTALVVPTDVTRYDQVERMIKTTVELLGPIDVMVNNAGHAVAKSVVNSSVEEIDAQIGSNFRAVCYGTKAVLPGMIERKTGNIINIGSNCSFRHYPDYAAYVGAKHAVIGFSRSVYEEVREQGIRVNCLCPAAVNTAWADVAGATLPWDKEQRLQPEDLAEMALLCVAMPPRVQVDNILMWPVCESTV